MKSLIVAATILGTTAAGVLAADNTKPLTYVAPLASYSPVSGYSSFWLGAGAWTIPDDDYSGAFYALGGDSRVNMWVAPGFSVQGDVQAEATSTGFGDCCNDEDTRVLGVIGGHASWRGMGFLVGGFGGAVGGSVIDGGGGVLQTFAGVEAQAYLGNITLYGQAGGTWLHNANSYGMDMMFVRGVGRLFLTPNSKIQGEIGFARGNYSGEASDDPVTNTNFGLLYEHMFGQLSLFAEYAAFTTTNQDDPSYSSSEHQTLVGVRLYFQPGTLLANDRTGATLDLPTGTIFRPLAWTYYNY